MGKKKKKAQQVNNEPATQSSTPSTPPLAEPDTPEPAQNDAQSPAEPLDTQSQVLTAADPQEETKTVVASEATEAAPEAVAAEAAEEKQVDAAEVVAVAGGDEAAGEPVADALADEEAGADEILITEAAEPAAEENQPSTVDEVQQEASPDQSTSLQIQLPQPEVDSQEADQAAQSSNNEQGPSIRRLKFEQNADSAPGVEEWTREAINPAYTQLLQCPSLIVAEHCALDQVKSETEGLQFTAVPGVHAFVSVVAGIEHGWANDARKSFVTPAHPADVLRFKAAKSAQVFRADALYAAGKGATAQIFAEQIKPLLDEATAHHASATVLISGPSFEDKLQLAIGKVPSTSSADDNDFDPSQMGIVPAAVAYLAEFVAENEKLKALHIPKLSFAMFEVYGDRVYDLTPARKTARVLKEGLVTDNEGPAEVQELAWVESPKAFRECVLNRSRLITNLNSSAIVFSLAVDGQVRLAGRPFAPHRTTINFVLLPSSPEQDIATLPIGEEAEQVLKTTPQSMRFNVMANMALGTIDKLLSINQNQRLAQAGLPSESSLDLSKADIQALYNSTTLTRILRSRLGEQGSCVSITMLPAVPTSPKKEPINGTADYLCSALQYANRRYVGAPLAAYNEVAAENAVQRALRDEVAKAPYSKGARAHDAKVTTLLFSPSYRFGSTLVDMVQGEEFENPDFGKTVKSPRSGNRRASCVVDVAAMALLQSTPVGASAPHSAAASSDMVSKSAFEGLQKLLADAEARVEDLEDENVMLTCKNADLTKERDSLQSDLDATRQREQDLQTRLQEAEARISQLVSELAAEKEKNERVQGLLTNEMTQSGKYFKNLQEFQSISFAWRLSLTESLDPLQPMAHTVPYPAFRVCIRSIHISGANSFNRPTIYATVVNSHGHAASAMLTVEVPESKYSDSIPFNRNLLVGKPQSPAELQELKSEQFYLFLDFRHYKPDEGGYFSCKTYTYLDLTELLDQSGNVPISKRVPLQGLQKPVDFTRATAKPFKASFEIEVYPN